MKRVCFILLFVLTALLAVLPASALAAGQSSQELFNSGMDYFDGNGVEQDFAHAFSYFLIAGEINGYAPAQNMLGVCYRDGTGIEKDETIAEQYFSEAAEQGNEDAKKNLELLQSSMQKDSMRKETENNSGFVNDFADSDISGSEKNMICAECVSAGDTSATFRFSYSVTEDVASKGYSYTVFYGISDDFDIERVLKGIWTKETVWCDSFYSEPTHVRADDKISVKSFDQFVPGITYYYRAVIQDLNGKIIVQDETVRSFTTAPAGDSVREIIPGVPQRMAESTCITYKFTSPESGKYKIFYKGIGEIYARHANGVTAGDTIPQCYSSCWNNEGEVGIAFPSQKGETLYFHTINYSKNQLISVITIE